MHKPEDDDFNNRFAGVMDSEIESQNFNREAAVTNFVKGGAKNLHHFE